MQCPTHPPILLIFFKVHRFRGEPHNLVFERTPGIYLAICPPTFFWKEMWNSSARSPRYGWRRVELLYFQLHKMLR